MIVVLTVKYTCSSTLLFFKRYKIAKHVHSTTRTTSINTELVQTQCRYLQLFITFGSTFVLSYESISVHLSLYSSVGSSYFRTFVRKYFRTSIIVQYVAQVASYQGTKVLSFFESTFEGSQLATSWVLFHIHVWKYRLPYYRSTGVHVRVPPEILPRKYFLGSTSSEVLPYQVAKLLPSYTYF